MLLTIHSDVLYIFKFHFNVLNKFIILNFKNLLSLKIYLRYISIYIYIIYVIFNNK